MPMSPPSRLRKSRQEYPWYQGYLRARRMRAWRVAATVVGVLLVAGVAFGATNWAVGVHAGSSGQSQAASIASLTITATASPSPVNLVYPGAFGDAVVTITNTS